MSSVKLKATSKLWLEKSGQGRGMEKTYQMCLEPSLLPSLLRLHLQPTGYHLNTCACMLSRARGSHFMAGLLGAIPDNRREQ